MALLKRQVALWLLVRFGKFFFRSMILSTTGVVVGTRFLQIDAATILVSAALGLLEIGIRRERIILGNLGISWAQVTTILIVPGVLLEVAVSLAGRL